MKRKLIAGLLAICVVAGCLTAAAAPEGGAARSFTDVGSGAFYAAPVAWAVDKQITSGTSGTTFSPDKSCTRGEIVTFLWRAAGAPEPSGAQNPYVDVKPSDFFYKPVLWAKETGVTSGTDSTHFSPGDLCTRGQAVTFMWRAAGEPANTLAYNPFKDVGSGAYYRDPVLWAAERGITAGSSERLFGPGKRCSRGEIVTFLYRYYVDPADVTLPKPESEIYKSVTGRLGRGAKTTLADVNGDGTDELLVYYGESSGGDLKFTLYTIKNGAAVAVVENRVLEYSVSAPSAGIGVAVKGGRRYLYTCGRNSGYTYPNTRHTGTLRLYSLSGTRLTLVDEVSYALRVKDGASSPFEAAINRKASGLGTTMSYSTYKSWVNALSFKETLGNVKGNKNAYF